MVIRSRPFKRRRVPGYPARLDVEARPDLLDPNGHPTVLRAGLASALAVAMTSGTALGCSSSAMAETGSKAGRDSPAVIAPVFEHGGGRGATGCVVHSPPYFMSEEEALQVIREELKRAGLGTPKENVKLESVEVPSVVLETVYAEEHPEQHIVEKRKRYKREPYSRQFEVDLLVRRPKIGVEFVSRKDHRLWSERSGSTVTRYNLKLLAEWIGSRVRRSGEKMHFGAFYDPMCHAEETDEERSRIDEIHEQASVERKKGGARQHEAKALYEKAHVIHQQSVGRAKKVRGSLLRAQVRDFVKWLEAQGAI